jgi:hypothetical protein
VICGNRVFRGFREKPMLLDWNSGVVSYGFFIGRVLDFDEQGFIRAKEWVFLRFFFLSDRRRNLFFTVTWISLFWVVFVERSLAVFWNASCFV